MSRTAAGDAIRPARRRCRSRRPPEPARPDARLQWRRYGTCESMLGFQTHSEQFNIVASQPANCRRDAEEDGALVRPKDHRCEHARDARLHQGCCTAYHLDEALCADGVLPGASRRRGKFCTRKCK